MHRSAGLDPRHVAGQIQPRFIRSEGQRIDDESIGSQIRLSEVADRQAGPEDSQLSHFAGRQRLPQPIDHHQAVIGERMADRHFLPRLEHCQAG